MSLLSHIRTEPNRHNHIFKILQDYLKKEVPHFSKVCALVVGPGARPYGYAKSTNRDLFLEMINSRIEAGHEIQKYESYEAYRVAKLLALFHTPELLVVDKDSRCISCIPEGYSFDLDTGSFRRQLQVSVNKLVHNMLDPLPEKYGKFNLATLLVVADYIPHGEFRSWSHIGSYENIFRQNRQENLIRNVDERLENGAYLVVNQGRDAPDWHNYLNSGYTLRTRLQHQGHKEVFPLDLMIWQKHKSLTKKFTPKPLAIFI